MQQIKTFWQVLRDLWRTGKTGIALFLISLFAFIYGYIALEFEIAQGWKGHISVQNVMKDISAFIPVDATCVGIIIGGIDLMMLLSDFFEARREKRVVAAAEAAAEAARAEGIAEGEARAYQKYAEWEKRRREAEARGEEFTEPLPTPQQQNNSKE